jgi:uncharacterized protein YjaG (DUF416 family)
LNEHEKPAVSIAKLSQGSVEAYILATADKTPLAEEIKKHPLMQFEIETQQSLMHFCAQTKCSKHVVKELKEDIERQNPSNLGLDI